MGREGALAVSMREGTVQDAASWLSRLATMLLCRQGERRLLSQGGPGSAVHNLWACSYHLAAVQAGRQDVALFTRKDVVVHEHNNMHI